MVSKAEWAWGWSGHAQQTVLAGFGVFPLCLAYMASGIQQEQQVEQQQAAAAAASRAAAGSK